MPKKQLTENRLRKKVFQVSHIIEQGYHQDLKVSKLANMVGLSVSHLHHAFQKIVGESIKKHMNRLRSEHAASLLKYSSWMIVDIGLACGFHSAASFSKGFKKVYGVSPMQFRNLQSSIPFLKGYFRSRPDKRLQDQSLPLPNVSIENWPMIDVICLRHYGPVYTIYKPWKELLKWAKDNISELQELRFLGLWFDEWSGNDEQHYRYECAIALPENHIIDIPEPFFLRTIPEGKTAVSYVRGNIKALNHSWYCFGMGWLPFSGFQPRQNYVIDQYQNKFILNTPFNQFVNSIKGDISLKMCIPIQKEALIY